MIPQPEHDLFALADQARHNQMSDQKATLHAEEADVIRVSRQLAVILSAVITYLGESI